MAVPLLALVAAATVAVVILGLAVLACRRWCRRHRRHRAVEALPVASQTVDLSRPLLPENLDDHSSQSNIFPGNVVEETSKIQTNRSNSLPRIHGIADTTIQGETHVIDVINDTCEEFDLGSTLKCAPQTSWPTPNQKHKRSSGEDTRNGSISPKDNTHQSSLALEVIAGPCHGICCSRQSTSPTLPIILGRVPPSDLVLKDSEVSGKHARISWNVKTMKWELVDMGSLNGTFLNSQAVHHPDVGLRHWGEPAELADGDIIALGTSSKLSVQISVQDKRIPAGVGIASDPMVVRRSGKKLPMEDISFCQCPVQGVEQFGLFAIFDGHGGDGAARAASKILPENVANILSHHKTKEKVLSRSDASDVLRYAFSLTEAALDHQYEGCTATALLIWYDHNKDCFAQCANLGDSACVLSVDGKMTDMTEDHRVASANERARIARSGQPLRVGEVRICGMLSVAVFFFVQRMVKAVPMFIVISTGLNLARVLGDKFLKEQDSRFSSEPYVSPAVHIAKASTAFAVIASDGLWDVITTKKAVQLVVESREKTNGYSSSADKIANRVLSEARNLRTKDNTSVIFVDFDVLRTDHCIPK